MTEAVQNRVVKVPLEIARIEGDSAKNVLHWADIEGWKLGCRPLVNHGDSVPLHAAVWGERNRLKCAEEHQ